MKFQKQQVCTRKRAGRDKVLSSAIRVSTFTYFRNPIEASHQLQLHGHPQMQQSTQDANQIVNLLLVSLLSSAFTSTIDPPVAPENLESQVYSIRLDILRPPTFDAWRCKVTVHIYCSSLHIFFHLSQPAPNFANFSVQFFFSPSLSYGRGSRTFSSSVTFPSVFGTSMMKFIGLGEADRLKDDDAGRRDLALTIYVNIKQYAL